MDAEVRSDVPDHGPLDGGADDDLHSTTQRLGQHRPPFGEGAGVPLHLQPGPILGLHVLRTHVGKFVQLGLHLTKPALQRARRRLESHPREVAVRIAQLLCQPLQVLLDLAPLGHQPGSGVIVAGQSGAEELGVMRVGEVLDGHLAQKGSTYCVCTLIFPQPPRSLMQT